MFNPSQNKAKELFEFRAYGSIDTDTNEWYFLEFLMTEDVQYSIDPLNGLIFSVSINNGKTYIRVFNNV